MAFSLAPLGPNVTLSVALAQVIENDRAITNDAMTIAGTKKFTGNVGIGGDPGGPLHVYANANANLVVRIQNAHGGAAADATLRVIAGNAATGKLEFSDEFDYRAAIHAGADRSLSFRTGAGLSEGLRIDNAGNVGIGGAPAYKLDVVNGRARVNANAEKYALSVSRNEPGSEMYWLGVTAGGFGGAFALSNGDGSTILSSTRVGEFTFVAATYRSGAESREAGTNGAATAGSQRIGGYQGFAHRRAAVPAVSLSATGSGIADINVASVSADGITVHGFRFTALSSAAGATAAYRTYTTSS